MALHGLATKLGEKCGLGLEVDERAPALTELADADEVWATNALVGVRRVGAVDDRQWSE